MRPGCDRPAAARLSYDTISCQVWLDQMPERLGPVQEICQFHAERLTVPRGWNLCDRRVDAPALFEPDHRAVRLPAAVDAADVSVAAVVPVATRGATGSPARARSGASTPSPRRSNRRRHPSSTARQLFDEDLDSVPPVEPVVDLDSDLEPGPELDLDTDLDAVEVGYVEPVAIVAPMAIVELVETDETGEKVAVVELAEIVSVDPDDDLPESLRATSPLLARAFRATGPQRSVLSADLASPSATEDEDPVAHR
jgi:Protein of unknown function (DUF3499)